MEMKKVSGRLIGGLIVIALGGLFLLDSLDILDFGEIIGWAVSVALILFGLGTAGHSEVPATVRPDRADHRRCLTAAQQPRCRFMAVLASDSHFGRRLHHFGGSRRRSRNRKRDAEGNSDRQKR